MKLFSALVFSIISLYAVRRQLPPPEKISSETISAPRFGEKLTLPGLPHAGKINDSLFRGAQPHKQGFEELKKLGITTIVDLRRDDSQKLDWERKQAESVGIRFLNIPVSGWAPPTNDQVAQFLFLFGDPREKVFVHCRFGDDRAGVFIATYRMAHDGWPASQAIKEMYLFGFNGRWNGSMKTYVKEFPSALQTAPSLAPFGNK
jgi:tyrosine-protein phosphatase SIW14